MKRFEILIKTTLEFVGCSNVKFIIDFKLISNDFKFFLQMKMLDIQTVPATDQPKSSRRSSLEGS